MAAKAQEWGGADVLMRWEMEELNAALEEYEARERLRRGARNALCIMIPFWLGVLLFFAWHGVVRILSYL